MIVSKPKRNTLFVLVVFTTICTIGCIYFMRQILAEPQGTWRYVALAILLISTSLLYYKLLFNYKVIKIHHDQVHIYFPFRLFKTVQHIKNLGAWQEIIIHTNKTEFKQLKLVFINKGFVKLTNKENSDYQKVYQYIKRKAAKKEIKE